jgi:hypothetical protein
LDAEQQHEQAEMAATSNEKTGGVPPHDGNKKDLEGQRECERAKQGPPSPNKGKNDATPTLSHHQYAGGSTVATTMPIVAKSRHHA